MTLNPDQITQLWKDLSDRSEDEIKSRLARGGWRAAKRPFVELYLQNLEKERSERFSKRDRKIQRWILRVAVAGVVVGVAGVIATLLTWRF